MEAILRIPRAIIDSILNAESDWIRYGLPALVLTVVFSALMLSKQGAGPEPQKPIEAPVHSKVAENFHRSFQQPAASNGSLPERPAFSPPPAAPIAESNQVRLPAADAPAAAAGRQKELAAEAVKWGWREEGRRALCDAVRASIPDFKAGKLHKHYTIHLARANFKGEREMADRAVDEALRDYERNLWNEAQCPEVPGQPRMSKGTIDAVIQRKQDWLKSH